MCASPADESRVLMSQRSDVTAIGRPAAGVACAGDSHARALSSGSSVLGRRSAHRRSLLVRLFAHSRSKINPGPVPSLLTISSPFPGRKIL